MSVLQSLFPFLFKEKISFPYRYIILDQRFHPNPVIELEVHSKQSPLTIEFLVDTGATVTSLPIRYADLLGITIDRRRRVSVAGVSNTIVSGFRSEISLRIGKRFYPITCFFLENEFEPLLGRVDVWQLFSVTFDNRDKQIVFKRNYTSYN